jgi:hypothetical protein
MVPKKAELRIIKFQRWIIVCWTGPSALAQEDASDQENNPAFGLRASAASPTNGASEADVRDAGREAPFLG